MGQTYTATFKVKGSVDGEIQVNFRWNWADNPIVIVIPVTTEMKAHTFEIDGFGGRKMDVIFQSGDYVGDIEWASIKITHQEKENTQAPLVGTNILSYGDAAIDFDQNISCESENFSSVCAWSKIDNSDYNSKPAQVEYVDGERVFVVHATDCAPEYESWANQFFIQSPKKWTEGDIFRISFRYKASQTAKTNTQCFSKPEHYLYWQCIGDVEFTTEWQTFSQEIIVDENMSGMSAIGFNLNAEVRTATDFYFDDLVWEDFNFDEGWFVATDATGWDYDNAIKLVYDDGDGHYEGIVGTASSPVSQIMISTARGREDAFLNKTIRVKGDIVSGNDFWNDFESGYQKIELPQAGIWSIWIDQFYKQVYFYLNDENKLQPHAGETVSFGKLKYWLKDDFTCVVVGYDRQNSNLREIEIPEEIEYGGYKYSVTEIGYSAFAKCDGLNTVTIPNSVTKIGQSVFSFCSGLSAIYGKFATEDNRCLIVDGELIAFAPKGITSYSIPKSVNKIGEYALGFSYEMNSVTIPNSVTEIGRFAFFNCQKLLSIEIPNSVTEIGEAAFSNCSNLTAIYGKFATEDNRCLIVDGELIAFAPKGVTSYSIPESVNKIGDYTFNCCDKLTSIIIPITVTEIGTDAFYGCSSLTSIELPNSVAKIGENAYNYCNLSKITCLRDNPPVCGDYVFWYITPETCVLKVLTESVELYKSTEPWSSFANIIPIVSPHAGETVEVGGLNYKLNEDYTCSVAKYNEGKPYSGEVVIPETITYDGAAYAVTEIADEALMNCEGVTSVSIPSSVTVVGDAVFDGCSSLTAIEVSEDNPSYSSHNGILYNKDKSKLIALPGGLKPRVEEVFYVGITVIGNGAFKDCDSFTSIKIPEGVTTIGEQAFMGNLLKSITLPSSVTTISQYAFYGCVNLMVVTILNPIPPVIDGTVFFKSATRSNSMVLRVPAEAVAAYEAADGWKDFGTIEAITSDIVVYNGNSTPIEASSLDDAKTKATAKNALIFIDAPIEENVGANIVMKDDDGNWVAKKINLTDGQPFYCPEDVKVGTLTYSRTFGSSSLRALYVPFSMNYSDWKNDFDIYRLNAYYEIDTDEDGSFDSAKLNFVKVTNGNNDLRPNHPYMISAHYGDASKPKVISLTNTTLYKSEANSIECSSIETTATFTGNYQTVEKFASNGYYRMNGGKFVKAGSDEYNLPPFSWYLKMESKDKNGQFMPAAPASIIIEIGDGTTELEDVILDDANDGRIFNLQGQEVNTLSLGRGFYIKNGKKFIVK